MEGKLDESHHHRVEIAMEIHKVETPPKRSSLQKLKNRLKETFFPDDPLRQFKGQSIKQKWLLGFQYIFPMLQWGPEYNLNLFKSDVVSGLTIASLAIPQGISYAKLANLPPIVGLCCVSQPDWPAVIVINHYQAPQITAGQSGCDTQPEDSRFCAPLVYAVLGAQGSSSGTSSQLHHINGVNAEKRSGSYTRPILLGFIIDFLSKATLIGFMAGAAIIVSLQQLKALLGITHFTKEMGLVPVMSSVFHNTKEWSWQTILMGSSFLIFLLVARHISIRKPKLFWVSAGAPLLSVILSTLIIFVFKAQKHGISVIGKLEQGLNPPSWNMLHFHGSHIGLVLKTGLITGIISLTEGIAVGRTFAAIKNYQVDGNKEMIAIGVMNVVGSTTSCYITTGAFSRSAVNHNAGAKTAVSNIVMAVTVMVTLLFLMPLFRYTPNLVLGAIIVTAVVGLIDLPAAYQIWKVDKFDFVVMLCAFFGVIFISVQEGLALAVGISIFKMVLQMTRPKTVVLGNIPGTDIFRNKHQYKDAVSIPGFLILSIQAPINFANSNYLNDRVLRWILDYEDEEDTKSHSSLRYVLLDLAAVSGIDTNGVTFFQELRRLVMVNPGWGSDGEIAKCG
ncbi:probable sulfate transporter 3.3 [Tanacetum coccineum]